MDPVACLIVKQIENPTLSTYLCMYHKLCMYICESVCICTRIHTVDTHYNTDIVDLVTQQMMPVEELHSLKTCIIIIRFCVLN